MIAGQEDFNKKYEELYKELTKHLNAIELTNIYKTQMNKIYPICKLFKDLAIKNPKTAVYISGYYGKKNRNNVYRNIVHQAVVNLKEANISSFSSALSTVEKLERLVTESAQKAKEIRLKFIQSRKVSADELLMTAKMIKRPCKLTLKDFTNFDEAINRLYYQLKNSSSESDFLNNKEELKSYLSKISNRRDFIKEQFKMIDDTITHEGLLIGDANLRSSFLDLKKRLNNERMNLCIYFSDVVDKYLTDVRIQNTSKPLTQKQVNDIEELVLHFRKTRISPRFQKKMEKLKKGLEINADVFTMIHLMSDLLEESGYIPFIRGMFKAVGLFTSGFDWEKFEKNMIMHLVLNSFDTNIQYLTYYISNNKNNDDELVVHGAYYDNDFNTYPKTYETFSKFLRKFAIACDKEWIKKTSNLVPVLTDKRPLISIYDIIIKFFLQFRENYDNSFYLDSDDFQKKLEEVYPDIFTAYNVKGNLWKILTQPPRAKIYLWFITSEQPEACEFNMEANTEKSETVYLLYDRCLC